MSSTHHHTHSQVPPNSQINTTNHFLWCIWRFLGHQFPHHTPPILQQSHAEFYTKYRSIAMDITSLGLITPPIFKLATISLPYSVYEEILVIYYLLTPLCLPLQQLHLTTPADGQHGHSPRRVLFHQSYCTPHFQISNKSHSLYHIWRDIEHLLCHNILLLATTNDTPSATHRTGSLASCCYSEVITPPIFKLATKVIPSSVYEEVLAIYYVIPPFCWPPLTIPLWRVMQHLSWNRVVVPPTSSNPQYSI